MTGPSRNKHSTTQGFVQCYSFTFFLEFQRLWKWNTERGEIMGWCEIKPAGKPVYLRVRRRNKTYSNCGCACLSSLRAPLPSERVFLIFSFFPQDFSCFQNPFFLPLPPVDTENRPQLLALDGEPGISKSSAFQTMFTPKDLIIEPNQFVIYISSGCKNAV